MDENEINDPKRENEPVPPPSEETSEPITQGVTVGAPEPESEADESAVPAIEAGAPSDDAVFERQAEEDLAELKRLAPEAADYRHLGEMPGALRFAELRGLGLSVEEAYYAVRGKYAEKPSPDRGGRAHLHGSVPGRAATGGVGMTAGEIEAARRLFPGLPDREIASLFRRVNDPRNQ